MSIVIQKGILGSGGVGVRLIKNISPITTFVKAAGLSEIMNPGDTIDVSAELSTSFTEDFVKCTGAKPLDVDGQDFTTFLFDDGAGNTAFVFPDIDETTSGAIDIREVGISCRISGTFSGNLDSVVLVEYYMLERFLRYYVLWHLKDNSSLILMIVRNP